MTVLFEGRHYLTSQELHVDLAPTSSVSATNKAIRSMETYDELRAERHLVEVDWGYAKSLAESNLESAMKLNNYRPLLLIDPVAQKAIEHHFEVSARQAVQSSRENAYLSLAGIDLSELAKDPQAIALIKAMSDAQAARRLAANAMKCASGAEERVVELSVRVDGLSSGELGYTTVAAFARYLNVSMDLNLAKRVGKEAARTCKAQGIRIGRVRDERWGEVGSYPRRVVAAIFGSFGFQPRQGLE